ncbi:hypothetical protein LCGC14_0704150 [marine sediment metagenome]|uniref:Uncharacterized protein n=1 Tax=marine sediment metagenome TaxID=412755 RepID=A0A0F9TPP4_9ZZZZ
MKDFVSLSRYYNSASLIRCIGKLSPRNRYYHKQHKKRWERRYEQPYPECEGEVGTIEGVRWIHA